jgi:hypothetical protein
MALFEYVVIALDRATPARAPGFPVIDTRAMRSTNSNRAGRAGPDQKLDERTHLRAGRSISAERTQSQERLETWICGRADRFLNHCETKPSYDESVA